MTTPQAAAGLFGAIGDVQPQSDVKDALELVSMLLVVVLIMMSANQFGPSVLVLLMIVAITQLVCCNSGNGMSLLNLGEYYNSETKKAQFPGFNKDHSISAKIQDIVLRVVVTMVIIAFCVKSGIFQVSNLNPGKMFM
tara:strand:+ start:53 stop:466 length:414 start_codon:yes stop_codon:yes gene_type:complete